MQKRAVRAQTLDGTQFLEYPYVSQQFLVGITKPRLGAGQYSMLESYLVCMYAAHGSPWISANSKGLV